MRVSFCVSTTDWPTPTPSAAALWLGGLPWSEADGKIAVAVAAMNPAATALGVAVLAGMFGVLMTGDLQQVACSSVVRIITPKQETRHPPISLTAILLTAPSPPPALRPPPASDGRT